MFFSLVEFISKLSLIIFCLLYIFTTFRLVESHELFISQSMSLIKNQVSLLENFRQDKISLSSYQKDLIDQIENQRKLVSNFHMMLTTNPSPSFGGDKPLSNFDSWSSWVQFIGHHVSHTSRVHNVLQ